MPSTLDVELVRLSTFSLVLVIILLPLIKATTLMAHLLSRLIGQATTILAERFATVTGVDPSPGMISKARESTSENNKVSFVQSNAEELAFAGNESADLVIAGALSGSN